MEVRAMITGALTATSSQNPAASSDANDANRSFDALTGECSRLRFTVKSRYLCFYSLTVKVELAGH